MPPRRNAQTGASKGNAKASPATASTPTASDAKLAQLAREAADLKKKQKAPADQLKEGAVMLVKQFVFLSVAILASYASQLALAPVYGEIGAGLYHSKIATVVFIVGWAGMNIFEMLIPAPVLVLAVWASVAPQLQTYLFSKAAEWGPENGPIITEALTTYPIIFLAAMNGAKTLKGSVSGHLIPGIACFRLFQTMFGLMPYQSFMSAATALVSGTVYAGLVLPGLLTTNFYNPRCTWNGGSAAGKAELTKTLTPLGYKLLDRQESITGYISVLESENDHFKVLRCDHSLLGGEWLAPPAGYEHLAPTGGLHEPIYAVFVMQEAVRLIEPAPAAEKKTALVIGLGIGTAVNGLIKHGIETDIIEIDPVVHAFATKHFGLLPNHTAHLENALEYMGRQRSLGLEKAKKFSYIIHDVFTGGAVPPSLFTSKFLGVTKDLLQEDGVIAINYAGDLNLEPAARILSTIYSVFNNKCRVFREDEPQGTEAERAERDFTNVVIFCLNAESPATTFSFRKPVEYDYLGTLARRKFLVPVHEVDVEKMVAKVEGGREVITVENAEAFAEKQRISAVGHWKVMRGVLPDAVWENY